MLQSLTEVRATLSRVGTALLAGGLALGAGGCWFYAVQYAPIAMQATTSAASSAVGAVERAAGYDPAIAGGCGALKTDDVAIIELRAGAGGNPEYRDLHLDDSASQPRLTPALSAETDADGWRPAVNFARMKFTPPLQDSIPKTGTRLLAYTAAESDALDNDTRLAAFANSFGQPVGTFAWGDIVYLYTLPPALPCVSPPPTTTAGG